MERTILVLHGMTMSGSSMVRCLGPLASRLEKAGYELLAPDAPHRLGVQELESFLSWVSPVYAKHGRDAKSAFRKGVFWDEGELCDWLRSETDPDTGVKTYHALEQSLEKLDRVTAGRNVVGVIGFSQGAILATLLEALGAEGDARFPPRRFGLYVAGSPPAVQKPVAPRYPIESHNARLLVCGGRDPFFDGEAALARWAAAFSNESETLYVPDLGHQVPSDETSVARMTQFVQRHAG